MKLTIVGSGVAASHLTGIKNRALPAYVVEIGPEKILFDCGEGTKFSLEACGFAYHDFHHIAISHPHPDHNALIHFLQATFCHGLWDARAARNAEWQVYCPQHIVDHFPAAWNFYNPDLGDTMFDMPVINWHSLTNSTQTHQIGEAMLSARSVHHGNGRADALAFRLEAGGKVFAYSGDSGDCAGLREVAQGADVFLCEASARVGDDAAATGYGHLSPFKAGVIARETGVKTLVLTHYTGLDTAAAMIQDCVRSGFDGQITLAEDGQVYQI